MDSLLLNFGTVKLQWHTVLLSFLCALVLSSAIALVYQRTFQGLSWSRGFMQSLVLGSVIACLLMIAIGDNVARGIGIVGSLAVIRYRTNLRDSRDLVFVFASMGAGVAAGVQSFTAAAMGSGLFCLAALAMNTSAFGRRHKHDGLVRFQLPNGTMPAQSVASIMQQIPRSFALVTMRNVVQGQAVDCVYQVKLASDSDSLRLLSALEEVDGIRNLTYMNQQTTEEV